MSNAEQDEKIADVHTHTHHANAEVVFDVYRLIHFFSLFVAKIQTFQTFVEHVSSGANSIGHGGTCPPPTFTHGWARRAPSVEEQQTRN